jgi:hypothetical protein
MSDHPLDFIVRIGPAGTSPAASVAELPAILPFGSHVPTALVPAALSAAADAPSISGATAIGVPFAQPVEEVTTPAEAETVAAPVTSGAE